MIGGIRCGTTSLYHYLGQHKCIKRAAYDEVGYFDENFQLGLNWYRSLFPTKFTQKKIESKYNKFLTYDVTPFYIYNPLAVDRIFKFSPNAKIIAVLRNPIDRAYSNYNQQMQDEGDTKTTFEEIVYSEVKEIEKGKDDLNNHPFLVDEFYELLLARGFYAKQLTYWFEKFPRKNILLISSEDFASKTDEILSRIFDFLDIPNQKIVDLTKQNKRVYPKIKSSTRDFLIDYFKPHNEKLFKLLGERFNWEN